MDKEVPFDWDKHKRDVEAALAGPVYKPYRSSPYAMNNLLAAEWGDFVERIAEDKAKEQDMDKAKVIREFLEFGANRRERLVLCEDDGEHYERCFQVEQAIQNFVESQEQASQPMADATVLDVPPEVLQGPFGWPWKRAPKYPAPLHDEPTTYYISPEWTPTAETLRQWKEAWGERPKC